MPEQDLKDYDEKELLAGIAEGDEWAFTFIFNKYRNKIYTVAWHLTESGSLAEEIVQDVFMKVWMKREILPSVRQFDDWLFIIARNEAYSCLRQMARQESKAKKLESWLPGQRYDADDTLAIKQYDCLLLEAVKKLPRQQQQVYVLNKEQGLNREEIAGRLNVSPETVKAHLALAVRTVRAYCLAHWLLCITILLTADFFLKKFNHN